MKATVVALILLGSLVAAMPVAAASHHDWCRGNEAVFKVCVTHTPYECYDFWVAGEYRPELSFCII